MKSQFASAFPLLLLTAAVVAGDPAVAAGAAAPAEAAPAPAPVPAAKPARDKANGVSRPSAGTATGNVWAIADKISTEKGRPALRAEVTAAGAEAGINSSTVTTQFGQWRRFYGLKKEVPVEGAVKPETAKQKEKREKAEAKAAAKAAGAAPAVVTTDAQVAAGNAAAAATIAEANEAEAGATIEG